MYVPEKGLWIAHCQEGPLCIIGKMANRHGLIAGATGTGKTVTLQVMAETFSQAGVPCFMADMKGDLSGISQSGQMSSFIEKRMAEFGITDPKFHGCPVRFFDVFGEQGHPMRCTISEMGPQLLSRILGLNETQEGVLNVVFRVADELGLMIIDIKDLRSMLNYVSEHAKEYTSTYGNIAPASVGAIQRSLLTLENEGGDKFFGEPSFDIKDLLQTTADGKGIMNVLAADKLMMKPKLYSTFLLWLLSELYSSMPEVGDLDMPKLVFFFDEAHTLFEDTSKALVDKIEQVVRLIRSKGVGVYFVTQSPTDIPETILGQLGNRVQHALRAFTPKDQKAVQVAAETFRANPAFDTSEAITNLGTGEALVSFLDEKGAPGIVQKSKILFPLSQIGAITATQRDQLIKSSNIYGKYDTPVDNVSAYEQLLQMAEEDAKEEAQAEAEEAEQPGRKSSGRPKSTIWGKVGRAIFTAVTASIATSVGTAVSNKVTGKKGRKTSTREQAGRVAKNATSAATRTITREISRSILGNLIK
jgi:DNA helicase HerA-like ATPase